MATHSIQSAWNQLRSFVYDRAIPNFTHLWYKAVLSLLPDNAHILDVGVGTGTALCANAHLLRSKNITVLAIDYDMAYVEKCRRNIIDASLSDLVTATHADIFTFTPPDNKLFDAIYFGASFMIMPDQVTVLNRVIDMLVDREDGRIYFTQTFELKKNTFMEWLKPNLATLTTIDFGKVTYEADFEDVLLRANLSVVSSVELQDGMKVDGVRESRLICAKSALYPTSSSS